MTPLSLLLCLVPQVRWSPSPQELVDLAEPGSVLVLPEIGMVQEWPTLELRKPLTLISNGYQRFAGVRARGSGALLLAGLESEAPLDVLGFDELRVIDSRVGGLLSFDLPYALLERVTAAPPSDAVHVATLEAPTCVLVLVESDVAAPATGHGLTVDTLFEVDARVDRPSARIVGHAEDDLELEGRARPGGHLRLAWTTPGPAVGLFVEWRPTRPRLMFGGARGVSFLSPQAQLVAIGGSPGAAELEIPPDHRLVGTLLTFQAWNPPATFSRPQFCLIR